MLTSDIFIRNASPKDALKWAKMLLQLDNEVIYSVFEPGERATQVSKYEEKILESQKNYKSAIFFAFDKTLRDEPIVGFLCLDAFKNKRKNHVATAGIGVLKSHYAKGIGNQLMSQMVEHAKKYCLTRIEAHVAVCNQKSIKLAEKFGFVIEGRKTKAIKLLNNYQDEFLMALDVEIKNHE
ncbi:MULTISPECIES: GNAT family N-acetyltransferase [Legionellaceae]|uniref:Protein N-acetyltransferase, RimJ/RimL family n=1 Tax=Fluoribacter gormanii TaxID=464 RepID=A0A377GFY6_9GAMM|nr:MULTISPECIES: GNAT family protein [Legionellaceae]KTD02733.1 putative acetyltransferase YhhY [Fluoribacter gormanii]MCW8386877.1 GNAT family N-acetyltransferase [Fluoribacter dumoffii]QIN36825.1 GNAT family N-acetyltransferase [Legionella longbeachae]SIR59797.1 Protein N-acetyltransferase, RimJ/RimL family [Fluoribacter gormanii]STO23750.1 putative acetyltransferase YhhY [Fluoribacter gormanii]